MIKGIVTAKREAIVNVSLHGPTGRKVLVKAVVDTGFNRFVCVPPAVIARLRLLWVRRGRAILADGSDSFFDTYEGIVSWDGRALSIPIYEVEAHPLVGMALLEGHELKAEVRMGGRVTIKRLPRRRRT
jgi:clan AA aspartic protease